MQSTDKMSMEREKLQVQKDIAQTNLQIARENKNQFDKSNSKKDKKK